MFLSPPPAPTHPHHQRLKRQAVSSASEAAGSSTEAAASSSAGEVSSSQAPSSASATSEVQVCKWGFSLFRFTWLGFLEVVLWEGEMAVRGAEGGGVKKKTGTTRTRCRGPAGICLRELKGR